MLAVLCFQDMHESMSRILGNPVDFSDTFVHKGFGTESVKQLKKV